MDASTPFVGTGALPPYVAARVGRHRFRRKRAVVFRMPLARHLGMGTREAMFRGGIPAGAVRASRSANGPVRDRSAPLMIRVSPAAPPHPTRRPGDDVAGGQGAVPGRVPLRGDARVRRRKRIGGTDTQPQAKRTLSIHIQTIVQRNTPFVVVADRAFPPDPACRSGDDERGRQVCVPGRMPLLCEIRAKTRQVVGDRSAASAAEGTSRPSGGPVVRRSSPFVVRTAGTLPPDATCRAVRNLGRLKIAVARGVPLSQQRGPPTDPVRRALLRPPTARRGRAAPKPRIVFGGNYGRRPGRVAHGRLARRDTLP